MYHWKWYGSGLVIELCNNTIYIIIPLCFERPYMQLVSIQVNPDSQQKRDYLSMLQACNQCAISCISFMHHINILYIFGIHIGISKESVIPYVSGHNCMMVDVQVISN